MSKNTIIIGIGWLVFFLTWGLVTGVFVTHSNPVGAGEDIAAILVGLMAAGPTASVVVWMIESTGGRND